MINKNNVVKKMNVNLSIKLILFISSLVLLSSSLVFGQESVCTSNEDCFPQVCDIVTRSCVSCINDPFACSGYCDEESGECKKCTKTSQCLFGYCNITTGNCENCTKWDQCWPKACIAGKCVSCTVNNLCPTNLCNKTSGNCTQCNNDNDCADDEKCNKNTTTNLMSCEKITGVCGYAKGHKWIPYECCADSDCPAGKSCFHHACLAICPWGTVSIQGTCKQNPIVNLSMIVLGISFLVIAMMFMFGRVLQNARIENWVKNEFYELIGTTVIFLFYILFVLILDNVLAPIFASTNITTGVLTGKSVSGDVKWQATASDWSISYLNGLQQNLKDRIRDINGIANCAGLFSSASIQFSTSLAKLFFPVFPAFGSVSQAFMLVLSSLTTNVIFIQIQKEILYYSPFLFAYLLPCGILLRAFPITRKSGGAIIAIVIGFTLILPFSYLISHDIFSYVKTQKNCSTASLYSPCKIGDFFESSFMSVSDAFAKILENFRKDIGCVILVNFAEAIVVPLLAYVMMLNIVRHIAEMFGAHVDFSTLVRLI